MKQRTLVSPFHPLRRAAFRLPRARAGLKFDSRRERCSEKSVPHWGMDARPLKFITAACAGEMLAGSAGTTVTRICTDSRQAQEGDLFFAIAGEKFDGHDFLNDVARRGVAAVVIDISKVPGTLPGCAVIAVDNTRLALGRLAAAYRQEFSLPIVGVGGSNGKTTTKELLSSVLQQKLASLSSEASFNNDIGVPLTLLRLEKEHQAAVIELGTNHPGELAPLVKMAAPKFGVITSIGREHLEFFGNLNGVADEEGWLAELLPVSGKLFINGDTEMVARIIQRTCAATERVGFEKGNDWRIVSV
ncbi:MAG TPA: UDP-N-acetylmuramoyl-tripeptide--D-alanyl-D-alanine ligase, partial [Verrucomicrobiae bacterium]|nr:UDP-N-acetylmuramoyl-tripeptide--D-alanyl-D-alanine ligase [Verrucomicrobiae bacterium]